MPCCESTGRSFFFLMNRDSYWGVGISPKIQISPKNHLYVTVLRKNGLIAGLAKIDFFPEMASTKLRYCLSKYERFTKLSFHAMTLNSRPFTIIVFLMFEENAFRVCC